MGTSELILGIDDAGRGPVIGPMVLTGCLMDKETELELSKLGVKDSKMLFYKKRKKLASAIKDKVLSYKTKMATPAEIDTGMGTGLNLNQIEAMLASIIVTKLVEKLSSKERENLRIVIDCPSNNIISWKKQLVEYLDKKAKDLYISCEHKADVDHISVSAASILSKVARDGAIDKLKKKLKVDFGSGYPSDPKTRKFLNTNYNKYKKEHIFRETWSTYRKAKDRKNQMKLPDY